MTRTVLVFFVISTFVAAESSDGYGLALPVDYYPFFVAVLYYISERHLLRQCTGSVIKAHIVLTSSHCLQDNVGFIEYGLSATPKEKSEKEEKKLKKVIRLIIPTKKGKVPKDLENADTIGLLVIVPFRPEDNMEIYGSLSARIHSYLGHSLTFAGLRPLNVPADFSGTNYPSPDVFTGTGVVVQCLDVFRRSTYGCIKEDGYGMPARSGGPVMYGDEIVGVINRPLKLGIVVVKDTFTFIPVHKHLTFIEKESLAIAPLNKSSNLIRKGDSSENIGPKNDAISRVLLRLQISTSF